MNVDWERKLKTAGQGPIHHVTRDGRWGVAVARGSRGRRDLSGHAVALADWVQGGPQRQGLLVIVGPQPSGNTRLRWSRVLRVLRTDLAARVHLILSDADAKADRFPPWLPSLVSSLQTTRHEDPPQLMAPAAPSRKFFEVFKLLLLRWIRKQGTIQVFELARQAGCSYLTVFKALSRLEGCGELGRASNRSVCLSAFPHRTWREISTLLPALRRSVTFVDGSGRAPDPAAVFARLKRHPPEHVALGGVHAASFWHKNFNLAGTPRVDLVVHEPRRRESTLSIVAGIDAALRPSVTPGKTGAVLAVHRLGRRESHFAPEAGGRLSYADEVETLLDLHDLGLTSQAEELLEFVTHGH